MSAAKWSICPKCKREADLDKIILKGRAEESYGKIPAEDYLDLSKAANAPTRYESTLREDYEIGTTEDGEFYVTYSCYCETCGFVFEFERTEKVLDY